MFDPVYRAIAIVLTHQWRLEREAVVRRKVADARLARLIRIIITGEQP